MRACETRAFSLDLCSAYVIIIDVDEDENAV